MTRRPAELRGGKRLGGALAGWVDGARRHASWIVLGSALFTLACAFYAARNLGVETDTEALFDPELPFRRLESQLDAAFQGRSSEPSGEPRPGAGLGPGRSLAEKTAILSLQTAEIRPILVR